MKHEPLYTNVRLENFTEYLDSTCASSPSTAAELNSYLWHQHIFCNTLEEYRKCTPSNFHTALDIMWIAYEEARKAWTNSRSHYEVFLNWVLTGASLRCGLISLDVNTGDKQTLSFDIPRASSFKVLSAQAFLRVIRLFPPYSSLTIHLPTQYLADNCVRMNAAASPASVCKRICLRDGAEVSAVWRQIADEMCKRSVSVKHDRGGFYLRSAREVAERCEM